MFAKKIVFNDSFFFAFDDESMKFDENLIKFKKDNRKN